MKTLDRYIIRELVVPFLIGTVAVVLMFQANTLIYMMKTYSVSNVPPLALAQIILYKTPDFLRMTLPVGMALASSLAMSRLTRESELTAIRGAGASIVRVLYPVAFFGLLVGALNFYVTEKVYPVSEKKFNEVSQQAFLLGTSPEYKSNVVIKLHSSVAYFASVQRINDDKLLIRDAVMYEQTQTGEVKMYRAPEGIYDRGFMDFQKGDLYVFKDSRLVSFKSQRLRLNERVTLADLFTTQQPADKTMEDLKVAIADGKKLGRDVTSLEVDYFTRFSVPFSCLVFAVAGPVFAIYFGRTGGFVGVLLSILMVMLYYNIFVISTQIFGRNGWMSPMVSAWLPNIILLVLGAIGLRRLE